MTKIDLSDKRIFVAPLNWGLGHATRSMVIIQYLLERKATVILGGDGHSFNLLKKEFPNLAAIELPSYDVKYTGNAAMVLVTLMQAPKYLLAIKREHDLLNQLIIQFNLDYVISDNRYGLWSKKIPSIFICHQIALIPPPNLEWGAFLAYQLQRKFIDRFDSIWIPDFPGEENLTGRLTKKYPLTKKMMFIGVLSRFQNMEYIRQDQKLGEIDIVCVLSGPEPQRTILEHILMKQFHQMDRNILLVRGITDNYSIQSENRLTTVSYLTALQLNAVLRKAKAIIARSGYSTIMDLYVLGKKAILIPTPGQTEQMYLANKLKKEKKAIVQEQSKIDIKAGLAELECIVGFSGEMGNTILEKRLNDFFK